MMTLVSAHCCLRNSKEKTDMTGHPDQKVHQVPLDPRGMQDLPDPVAHLDSQERWDQKVNLVLEVKREKLETMDSREHKDQWERKGKMVFKVLKDRLVEMDSPDKKET